MLLACACALAASYSLLSGRDYADMVFIDTSTHLTTHDPLPQLFSTVSGSFGVDVLSYYDQAHFREFDSKGNKSRFDDARRDDEICG